jgi:hypothetical protein
MIFRNASLTKLARLQVVLLFRAFSLKLLQAANLRPTIFWRKQQLILVLFVK